MTNEIRPASPGLRRAFPVIVCFLALFFLVLSSACDDDTPTDPSAASSLSGTVIESAPNTAVLIAGATVTLDGVVNAGKTTTTNVAGVYSFEGLSEGTFSVRASKPGYDDNSLTVSLSGSQTGVVVPLRPVRRVVNETLSGAVRALDPICEGSGRPCARGTSLASTTTARSR
jgi:hypothetical protein